jgi:hypothetical protein
MLENIFVKNVSSPPSDKKHEVIRPLVRGPWLDKQQMSHCPKNAKNVEFLYEQVYCVTYLMDI